MSTAVPDTVIVQPKRRWTELFLLLVAWSLGFGGYLLTELNIHGTVPSRWHLVGGVTLAVLVVCHLVVRFALPWADPVILPVVVALNGIGLAMIHRIDLVHDPARHRVETQLIWTLGGIILWALTVTLLRDYRRMQRFPYILFIVGLVLLLLPLVPKLGMETLGSRIWIHIGHYTFQPAEIAKVLLVVAFAAYLVDKRDVLSAAGRRLLGITFPRARDLGPIAVMWIASMLVIVYENDLGTGMLFFGMFVVMLYVATGRIGWVILGGLSFAVGAWAAMTFVGHVRVRVDAWLHPFDHFDQNRQVIQAQYGMAWGGLAGRGWGLGRPGLVSLSWSDFIASSIGEELGVTGLIGIILLYAILVARGLRAALACRDDFGKLLAAGLSLVFALQVFAIIGGVTRLLPLTGLTTPFMSQGGSSLIANWVIIGIVMAISHQSRRPDGQTVPADGGDR
ncbi:FtsW/RodA/SpoVE family cell cycle protein [Acidipropionibacterium timonense]|uniref:FtsW/RodA/SpoVE family cell cycle protein n=1 Tax=Acidipropionibacterium timonense TaxID=2161818 RepID=UPI00102F8E93|nr:FtsW/RodA/SpoVE family cell cycle protein [Acidipropionibacterium timonense]